MHSRGETSVLTDPQRLVADASLRAVRRASVLAALAALSIARLVAGPLDLPHDG
jgi:hypothetical protein